MRLSEDTAKRQLRAYVFPDAFRIDFFGKKIVLTANFKNTGQTPAFEVRAEGVISGEKEGTILRQSQITSKQDYGSYGRDAVFVLKAEFDTPDELADDFKNRLVTIRLKGSLLYTDVFGDRHTLGFDSSVLPFPEGKFIMVPNRGDDKKQ